MFGVSNFLERAGTVTEGLALSANTLRIATITGSKIFNTAVKITGTLGLINDVREGYKEWNNHNKIGAVWNGVKFMGTAAFMIFGGEEATLTYKATQITWGLATDVVDLATGH